MLWFFGKMVLIIGLLLQNPCLGFDPDYRDGITAHTETLLEKPKPRDIPNDFIWMDLRYSERAPALPERSLSSLPSSYAASSDGDSDSGSLDSKQLRFFHTVILSDNPTRNTEHITNLLPRRLCRENASAIIIDSSYVAFIKRLDAAFQRTISPYPQDTQLKLWSRRGISAVGGLGAGSALCGTFMSISADDFGIPPETKFATAVVSIIFPLVSLCYMQQMNLIIQHLMGCCKNTEPSELRLLTHDDKTWARQSAKALMGLSSAVMSLAYLAEMAYYQGEEFLWFTASAGPFYTLSWFYMYFMTGVSEIDKFFNARKSPKYSSTPDIQEIMVKSIEKLENMVLDFPNDSILQERIKLIAQPSIETDDKKEDDDDKPFKMTYFMAKLDDQQNATQHSAQWYNYLRYKQAFGKPQVRHVMSDIATVAVMAMGTWGLGGIMNYSMPTTLEWLGFTPEASYAIGATLASVLAIPLTYGQSGAHYKHGRAIADAIKTSGRSIFSHKSVHNVCTRVTAILPTFVGVSALTSMTTSLGMQAFKDHPDEEKALFIASASLLTASSAYASLHKLAIDLASSMPCCLKSDKVIFSNACSAAKQLVTRLDDASTQTFFWLLMGGGVENHDD